MKKIKLIICHSQHQYDSWGDYSDTVNAFTGITDWQEVSDDDFVFIKQNMHYLNRHRDNSSFILIEQDNIGIETRIGAIKDEIEKLKRAEEKRIADEAAKREAASIARAAKKLERDKKALQKLLEKNPELVNSIASRGTQ